MMQALPPQTNAPAQTTQGAPASQVRPQHPPTNEQAQKAARAAYPGSTVVDVKLDAHGKPSKVHIKMKDGEYKTVILNQSQQVAQRKDGYC